ncbi:MAG: ATP-binding protein [Fuerstiella sp.]
MKSLRSNIYTGFAIIVALLIGVGLIGYLGSKQLSDSSAAMRKVSSTDAAIAKINRDVTELQLRVARYMATGHRSLQSDIIALNDHLIDQINQQVEAQVAPEMQDLFLRMSVRLPAYRSHFNSVIEERRLRADLVQQQLPNQSQVVHERLNKLQQSLPVKALRQANEAAILLCKSRFLEAERLLLRYYIAASVPLVTDASKQIELAIESLTPLKSEGEAEPIRQQLIRELKKYKRLGIRAVQATRSYLYLVNVVMAGEASEVTYFSTRLRSVSESQRNQIADKIAVTTTNIRRATGIGICIAVALGVLIASRLGTLILRPVTALKETFRQLAAGRTVLTIPESERKDEIGEMALAAEVFRQRNVEQRALLEKAESLAIELASKATELESSNAELDSFAYVASHDLKSPLRGIRQLAAWIQEDAGHLLPEESMQHFQAMQSRVQRMETLLEDLLNFSRIGRQDTQPEQVDLNELVNDVIELTDNPNQVAIGVPEPLPVLQTIRVSLEQVFMNLIGNAVKHNDKHENGRIDILFEQQDESYVFHFRDNGPGIEPQHYERVFQMYQRVGNTDVDGSGMGLAIVKKQIESHRGSIHLDSNNGDGVTFTVVWPESLV